MKMNNIAEENILNLGIHLNVAESPVWNSNTQRWHWLDQAGRIYEYDANEDELHTRFFKEKLGSLVITESGSLVVSGESSLMLLSRSGMETIGLLEHPHSPMKFADGRCDRQGRYMTSTMCPVITDRLSWGEWWNFSQDEGFKRADNYQYIIPNGSAFSPDGSIFYCSETDSEHRKIFKCQYDINDGVITGRSLLIDMKGQNLGRPDGAAVDTDGCYWICGLDDGVILRITPEGKIDQIFKTPMKKPTMCSFGGPDGKTMMVTSLSRSVEDLKDDPLGGQVMLFDLPYQGIEEPRLKGF